MCKNGTSLEPQNGQLKINPNPSRFTDWFLSHSLINSTDKTVYYKGSFKSVPAFAQPCEVETFSAVKSRYNGLKGTG